MPRREASGGTSPADISTLDFQPPGLGDNEHLLLKPPGCAVCHRRLSRLTQGPQNTLHLL